MYETQLTHKHLKNKNRGKFQKRTTDALRPRRVGRSVVGSQGHPL